MQIEREGIDGDGKFETEKNTFKPFPCGIVIHPVIDGCSQLREDGVIAEDVETIMLKVHPLVLELTGKKMPKDGLQAKFSVYFGAACGLLFGRATPKEYTDEIVQQTEELRSKIEAVVDQEIRPDECRIEIKTTSRTFEKHVEHAVGSLANPMSDAQFQQKFMDQVEPEVGAEAAGQLFSALGRILEAEDVTSVIYAA